MLTDPATSAAPIDAGVPGARAAHLLREARLDLDLHPPGLIVADGDEWQETLKAIREGAAELRRGDALNLRRVAETVMRSMGTRRPDPCRRSYQRELERKLLERELELERTYDGTVIGFAAMMEGKDSSTMGHLFRVRDYCTLLAAEVGIPSSRMRDVQLGAMLHDVGKHRVPDHILTKPGPLTDEEWAVMRRHPEFGADFVARIPFLSGAAEIILNHHEKFDGSGYPNGLAGEAIPLGARVFSVVDAYDAIVSERCYKPKYSSATALAEIQRCAGRQFDPSVAEAFERVLPRIEASAARLEAQHRRELACAGLGRLPDRAHVT
jgi:HD-GYP domain-containing protein (c-di-GMP phosphodiesterase class II)